MPILLSTLLKESVKKMTKRILRVEQDETPTEPVVRKRGRPPKPKPPEGTEPTTPKRGRGRPSAASIAAAREAELAAAREKAALSPTNRDFLAQARAARAAGGPRDPAALDPEESYAAKMAAAAAELKAAMGRQPKGSKTRIKGKVVGISPLPTTDTESPEDTMSSGRGVDDNPDDQGPLDIDRARGNRGSISLGERKLPRGKKK
jgi:hypothetical protein